MNILLAVDGSAHSQDAIKALAHFAPPKELTLVHAMPLPDLDHPMITPELRDEVIGEIESRLRREGRILLERARSDLPSDFSSIQDIQEIGSPAHVILETAKTAHADLIMIGARGLGPIKELVLGSVSHRVVLHAPCSTLVMNAPLPKLQKILLPLQGDDDAQAALKFLAHRPFRQQIQVEVMTVWPQPQVPWPITLGQSKLLEEKAIEHAQERLDGVLKELAAMNYQGTASVGLGSPAFAILEQARASKPDMLVVGSHGRKGLSRFLLGSVSHSVLHQATCPVVIVR